MAKGLMAALVLASSTVSAQTPAPAPAPQPTAPVTTVPSDAAEATDVDRKIEEAKKEIREEVRAAMAAETVAKGWDTEWTEQRTKLDLFELDGYLRVRPELFHKFDLNYGRDRNGAGYPLFFPGSPLGDEDRTIAGVNMRARFEPTLNISEEVRVRLQVDALDNLVFGSTPEYAFTRSTFNEFSIFNESQEPPRAGVNAVRDAIEVRRAYGEVSTPLGILRFGRMGSHWGLGMLRNDGNCFNCEYGDSVDRLQFVAEPFEGIYVTPMLDFHVEGPTSAVTGEPGQPFDLSNSDDSHSLILAIARRDPDQQVRQKLENGGSVLQYGVHFSLRRQRWSAVDFEAAGRQEANGVPGETWSGQGGDVLQTTNRPTALTSAGYVPRSATLYIPDLWARFETKRFRLEFEVAAQIGTIENRAPTGAAAGDPNQNQSLQILQLGGVAQAEVRFLEGSLRLQFETGLASGDRAPGMGIRSARRVAGGRTQRGDIDGPQYACLTSRCEDATIRNFRFNRDYRIDEILFQEILGTVTDAVYVKPTLTYSLTEGVNLFGSVIGSRAIYPESTPSGRRAGLGVELNAGGRYETEDGFLAGLTYAVLFPLSGLQNPQTVGTDDGPETAMAVKAYLGIRY